MIVATVRDGTAGQMITNTAEIEAVDQTDPVPGNDSDDAVLTVQEAILTEPLQDRGALSYTRPKVSRLSSRSR